MHFSVSAYLQSPVSIYQFDYEGDGVIDYTGETIEDLSYIYTTEGIFFPTITVIDKQGNVHSDTIAINVLSKTEIDILLKEKWEGMKGELANKDIEKAFNYIISNSQDMYKFNFELMKEIMPLIVQEMSDIILEEVEDRLSKYHMIVVQEGIEYSFYIEFVKDYDGRWKIHFF